MLLGQHDVNKSQGDRVGVSSSGFCFLWNNGNMRPGGSGQHSKQELLHSAKRLPETNQGDRVNVPSRGVCLSRKNNKNKPG